MDKCIICKVEDVVWATKDEVDALGKDMIDKLSLHHLFKKHHPEELCKYFRETDKIRQLRVGVSSVMDMSTAYNEYKDLGCEMGFKVVCLQLDDAFSFINHLNRLSDFVSF